MPDDTQRQNPEKLHPEKLQAEKLQAEKLQAADQCGAGQAGGPGRTDTDETPEDTYEPSPIEVNRGRERGLGVGQKDIDYQHDPTGVTPAERWVNPEPPLRVRPPEPLPPEFDPPPDN